MSLGENDILILDASYKQSLRSAKSLGRARLRVALGESIDECTTPRPLPAFRSKYTTCNLVLPSYVSEPTAFGRRSSSSSESITHASSSQQETPPSRPYCRVAENSLNLAVRSQSRRMPHLKSRITKLGRSNSPTNSASRIQGPS